MRLLFDKQRQFLNHFFDTIDCDAATSVLEKLLHCQGVVILSGVGKSGHIAQKISATLLSTGTRAMYLSAAHALHGDIGFVTKQDVFVALSKSGESQELLDLLPFVKKKGAYTIAVVSERNSRLAQNSDQEVFLPVEQELCPHNLAPTTSTAVQLLFGDCLAVALMQAKKFSVKDFASNHPAGLLGRKITLMVSDLMLRGDDLPLCRPADHLFGALHELSAKKSGCLLICDEGMRLRGIFTDGDLRRTIQGHGPQGLHIPMEKLMTQTPLATTPSTLAVDALRQMEKDSARLVTVLPVIDEGKLVGLLRMHDIIQEGIR